MTDNRHPAASDERPEHRPKGVYAISVDGLGELGVAKDGTLYWSGVRIVTTTEQRLARFERVFAALAVFAAVVGVTIQAWSWGCDLEWLDGKSCPSAKHQPISEFEVKSI